MVDEKRKSELAIIMLKRYLEREISLHDIANLKRNLGNVVKDTGISSEEILEFAELIIREIFEEQFALLKKSHKA